MTDFALRRTRPERGDIAPERFGRGRASRNVLSLLGRIWLRASRLTVAAALACTVVIASPPGALATSPTGVELRKPPPKWDERVADLASFVERTRRLEFKRPVPVRFLTDTEFRTEIATDEGDLSRQERNELEEVPGFLRALGLIELDAKMLLRKSSELDVSGVLAFYDPDEKEVVIRGTQLDIPTKVTVVHELTHVLQDQHFDLNKLEDKAGSAIGAVDALVEGDAIRLEDEYVSSLSKADQATYGEALERQATEPEGALPRDVPAVLEIIGGAPYSLGPTFVEAVRIARGDKGIDTAFRDPPKSDKQILTPSAYLSGDDPKRVDAPRLTNGEKRVGKPDTIGALGLYLTLAARVDPVLALPIIDSWAGDSFVQFKRGNTACVRATFVAKDPGNTERIAAVLEQWVDLGRRDAAEVERTSSAVTITACDPGRTPADTNITAAGYVLDTRASALSHELDRGAPLDGATCVAERAPFDSELRAVLLYTGAPTPEQMDAFTAKMAGLEAACGA